MIPSNLCITCAAERPLMEVGDTYFPSACLLHHTISLTFIYCKLHHAITIGLLVLSDGFACTIIVVGGWLEARMHGIAVFVPLWINLNCLGGVVHIPESSEVGDGQWNRNGHIVFVASPVAALTPLHSLLLANMHRFYCCLVVGGGAIVGRFANQSA